MATAAMKYTNQRVEILDFLKGNTSHPTVEQVYEAVRRRLSRISKATVYQNLKFLAKKGFIQEVNIKGVVRYEPNLQPHHHIICRDCGDIIDFESKELTDFSLGIARRLTGVAVERTNTNFYGVCRLCRARHGR